MVDAVKDSGARAWMVGAVLWMTGAAIEVVHVPDGAGFVAFEAVWIAAHLAILTGLLALRRLAPHQGRRLGTVGLGLAISARGVFLLGELDCLRTGTNESLLLPVGAMLTAIGMILFGVAVVRARSWDGWRRFAPLAMGIYPFVAMFPVVAVTGEPSTVTIGIWAVTFAGVGRASLAEGRRLRQGAPGESHPAYAGR